MSERSGRSKKEDQKDQNNLTVALRKKKSAGKAGGGLLGTENAELVTETTTEMPAGLKANQIVICKQAGCHDISTTQGYCRIHYLFSWKKLKTKEAKKKGQELEAYLEEMGRKFPEEFLEKLRSDVDEMIEKAKAEDSDEEGGFEALDGDEDIDTIIKGLRVEDY